MLKKYVEEDAIKKPSIDEQIRKAQAIKDLQPKKAKPPKPNDGKSRDERNRV